MILQNVPFDQYLVMPGVSNSQLKHFQDTPFHFYANVLSPDRPADEETVSKKIGKAFHTMFIERDCFDDRYAVQPEGVSLVTKEGRQFKLDNAHKAPLTHNAWLNLKLMDAAACRIPQLMQLMGNSLMQREVSVTWVDPEFGVQCKARPDLVFPMGDGDVIMLDVKTTDDVSPKEFYYNALRFGYDVQQAIYTDALKHNGLNVSSFIFVVVGSSYPHIAKMYTLYEDIVMLGKVKYRDRISQYAKCLTSGVWPAYGDDVSEIMPGGLLE